MAEHCDIQTETAHSAPRIDRTKPLLLFDGDCGFCRHWIRRWQKQTGEKIVYAPFQECGKEFPHVPHAQFHKSVVLVLPDKKTFFGAHAVFKALSVNQKKRFPLTLYEKFPLFRWLSELFYRLVASRRPFFGKLMAFAPTTRQGRVRATKTSKSWFGLVPVFGIAAAVPASYAISITLFIKAIGAIYFIAFASFGVQAMGLIGSQGVLPAQSFVTAVKGALGAKSFLSAPTLLLFSGSDFAIKALCIAGVILSLLVIAGVLPRLMLALLFVLYLSLVVAGQDFMSFQWDILLLEAGFLAIFLSPTSRLSILLLWFLLFKLMFLSGFVKLASGDASWRDLTALNFHFETQPLPTLFGWYLHQLPVWFKKFSTAVMFTIELGLPFLIFLPRLLRYTAGLGAIALQLFILATGNYTFFNFLTLALVIPLFDDAVWLAILPEALSSRLAGAWAFAPPVGGLFIGFEWLQTPILLALLLLNVIVFASAIGGRLPRFAVGIARFIAPFHIVGSYGLFAVMTKSRGEIVIEGSRDGTQWFPYEFKWKPGELKRPPYFVEPHQPRLDWQMWFASLRNPQGEPRPDGRAALSYDPWFQNLLVRLLEGSPPTLKLLRTNPFGNEPPKLVRALYFDYHFTSRQERAASGAWWKRELKGLYFPPASLQKR